MRAQVVYCGAGIPQGGARPGHRLLNDRLGPLAAAGAQVRVGGLQLEDQPGHILCQPVVDVRWFGGDPDTGDDNSWKGVHDADNASTLPAGVPGGPVRLSPPKR